MKAEKPKLVRELEATVSSKMASQKELMGTSLIPAAAIGTPEALKAKNFEARSLTLGRVSSTTVSPHGVFMERSSSS